MIAAPYIERVETATDARDLFPEPDAARSTYRRLARVLHPDVNPGDKRAEQAFARLTELWNLYNGKTPGDVRHPAASNGTIIYETKRYTFALHEYWSRGDLANLYFVSYVPGQVSSALNAAMLKMPRSPKNNDLIVNEITALKTLKEKVPEQYRMYHAKTVDSFRHKDAASGKDRRAIVTEYLDGFVSLREVLDAYPQGIDPRDVAWMARRLWIALDTAHEAGVAHGAVFPEHVMIHPADHGVVLIDWCYSRPIGETLEAAVPRYMNDGWYGSRYDKPLDHRLDVRQASLTLEKLLGLKEARPFRAFFNGCRVASAPPAGQLYEEFDDLLARLYGRRRYRPFQMPQGWTRKEP